MNFELDKHLSPAERFIIYFERAKQNYLVLNDCKKATNKSIVEWYNRKYKASLKEVSLSKYLNGTNEIPIDVYVNMKELAGIEEIYVGTSASRSDYEISCDLKESLLFIKEEIEFMCKLEELDGVGGESIHEIMKVFIHYCESASNRNYSEGIALLHELEKLISYNVDKIEQIIDIERNEPTKGKAYYCRPDCYAEYLSTEYLQGDIFIDSYGSNQNEYCYYWHGPTEITHKHSSYNSPYHKETKHMDSETRIEQQKDNVTVEKSFSDTWLSIKMMSDRYNNLYHFVHRCIYCQGKIDADKYMDIPALEEIEILRSMLPLVEKKV
ncbi:MAG: hypothetical protein IKY23_10430 [Lachnospiraceae bacterium]|nr:hypothetical protein [Lachnospiraceae bacterium]